MNASSWASLLPIPAGQSLMDPTLGFIQILTVLFFVENVASEQEYECGERSPTHTNHGKVMA